MPCRRTGRPAGAGFVFSFSLLLADSVSSASDFSVSFVDFSVCFLELKFGFSPTGLFVQSPSALLEVAAFGDFTHDVHVFILSAISNSF